MGAWLAILVADLMTKLGAWIFSRALAFIQGRLKKSATDAEIDKGLEQFKAAYKEAVDGEKVTPEQRKNLSKAISNFIRSTGTPGL